jgi:hypothetical protein
MNDSLVVKMNPIERFTQNETVHNINETLFHWSDDYSYGFQSLIFSMETIEWFVLLFAILGIYYGIEIGHPSKN